MHRLDELYNGTLDCVIKMIKNEGISSLYKGCLVQVVRSFAGAGTLVIFDIFKHNYIVWKGE